MLDKSAAPTRSIYFSEEHEQLRAQLGAQACQWAQRFSWQTIADETLSIYAKAANGHGRSFLPYMSTGRGGRVQLPIVERECP